MNLNSPNGEKFPDREVWKTDSSPIVPPLGIWLKHVDAVVFLYVGSFALVLSYHKQWAVAPNN